MTCKHHGCNLPKNERLLTVPTLITAVRTVFCAVFVGMYIATQKVEWLFVGLAAYWLGDVADGFIARRFGLETRTGAVLDILCDRFCVTLVYGSYMAFNPQFVVPLLIYIGNFLVIDNYLSLIFIHWPLLSPNYFYLVDKKLYNLNWSPLGKMANSSLVFIVMVMTQSVWFVGVVATVGLVIKVYSLVRLRTRISIPEPSGCCSRL
ncbi:MAG: CDP-alcohol phosphatidyltransferase family protein [Candidatus Woesebacteria bacterium]